MHFIQGISRNYSCRVPKRQHAEMMLISQSQQAFTYASSLHYIRPASVPWWVLALSAVRR